MENELLYFATILHCHQNLKINEPYVVVVVVVVLYHAEQKLKRSEHYTCKTIIFLHNFNQLK